MAGTCSSSAQLLNETFFPKQLKLLAVQTMYQVPPLFQLVWSRLTKKKNTFSTVKTHNLLLLLFDDFQKTAWDVVKFTRKRLENVGLQPALKTAKEKKRTWKPQQPQPTLEWSQWQLKQQLDQTQKQSNSNSNTNTCKKKKKKKKKNNNNNKAVRTKTMTLTTTTKTTVIAATT